MLVLLIIVIVVSLAISACCSLMEAALFAVPLGHVRSTADKGSKSGKILLSFKESISRPIAAILILNTISHTVGAAVAGGMVATLYGEGALIAFSAIFTLLILSLSEILPKQAGVVHAKKVALFSAVPLYLLVKFLSPLIVLTDFLSKLAGKEKAGPSVSQQELLSLTDIGSEEGVLDALQSEVIKNIISLQKTSVKNILTPRVVVFSLDQELTIENCKNEVLDSDHSRIPIYDSENKEDVSSYVMQRDIFRAISKGENNKKLKDIKRPLSVVPEFISVGDLFLQMVAEESHICAVVDEHGGFEGIVTLEDIIEEIVGSEIVDEFDTVKDLRKHARARFRRRRERTKS